MKLLQAAHAIQELENAFDADTYKSASFVDFLLWLAEEKFVGREFDDELVGEVVRNAKSLMKEHRTILEAELEEEG